MRRIVFALGLVLAALGPTRILGQETGGGNPPDKAFPAYKIIGNLYYVGTDTHSSFLVVTSAGDILIDSTYEKNVPLIQASVKKLGFNFSDIKIVVTSHAHVDHCEGDALVKQLTGATVMMMDRDVPAAEALRPEGKPHPDRPGATPSRPGYAGRYNPGGSPHSRPYRRQHNLDLEGNRGRQNLRCGDSWRDFPEWRNSVV